MLRAALFLNLVRKGGLEPPRPFERSHLKAVRLPISPLPRGRKNVYLLGGTPCCRGVAPEAGGLGAVTGGAASGTWPLVTGVTLTTLPCGEAFPDLRSRTVPEPAPRVAKIESDIEVSMKRIAEIVVAFESSVAEPRGPKAV